MARTHRNTVRLTNKERAWLTVRSIADVVPLIGRQKTTIALLIQRSLMAATRQVLARNARRIARGR